MSKNPGLNLVNPQCSVLESCNSTSYLVKSRSKYASYNIIQMYSDDGKERIFTQSPDKTIIFLLVKTKIRHQTLNKTLTIGLIDNQTSNTCQKTFTDDVLIDARYKIVIEY